MSLSKKIRYQLEYLAVKWLAFSIPLMPRKLAQWTGKIIGDLAYLFDKRGRTTALENLKLVFGDSKDETERIRIAKDCYRGFGRVVMDQFWSPRLNESNYLEYCTLKFDEVEEVEKVKETGAIWVTPHYSNFEWIAMIMGFQGYHFTIVARDFKNPKLTPIYKKNREMSGHEVIPPLRALLRLLKNLKRGGHAAFLSDLTIAPSKAATIIECFGQKVCVTAIHAQLMRRTGLPVIAGICKPLPDGRYLLQGIKAITLSPGDSDQKIAQACWDAFEPYIRENPAPWLWMYKHFRYISKDGVGDQPSYARSSEAFHELEERIADQESASKLPE